MSRSDYIPDASVLAEEGDSNQRSEVRRRAVCCLRRAKRFACLDQMGEIRGNARRRCDREDREMYVAVARDFGEEPTRSPRGALYQAGRRNASRRKVEHRDRIRSDSLDLYSAGKNDSSTRKPFTGFQDLQNLHDNPENLVIL